MTPGKLETEQQYFSARELAELKLPGLPSTRQGINKRASDDGWSARPREGHGGGLEYHVSALPEASRQAIFARLVSQLGGTGTKADQAKELTESITEAHHAVERQRGLADYLRMPAWAQAQADARLDIIRAWTYFWAHTSLTKKKARTAFARLYSSGEIDLGEKVREEVDSFKQLSLWRWQKKLRKGGPAALADERWKGETTTIIDRTEGMREEVLGMVKEHGSKVKATNVLATLKARWPEEECPSLRSVQRYLKEFREAYASESGFIDAPKTWRGRHLAAFGNRDDDVHHVNGVWELDSTLADVTLRTADGPKRFALVGCIDVYTRRLRYLVTDASRATAITLLLRRCLLAWGVPEVLRMDQGKDYTSKALQTVITSLRIEPEFCRAYHPEEKPYIERAYRTLQHSDMELLPGFVGHNVAERQAIRERQSDTFGDVPLHVGELELSPVEFQAWLDDWCTNAYAKKTHSGIGMSPRERAEAYSGPIKRIHDDRALDMLLEPVPAAGRRKAGMRTVQKKGIQVGATWYIAPELGAGYIGQDVMCFYDPHKAGRIVVYDAIDVAFVCLAVAPEGAEERRQIATKARKVQRQHMREEQKRLRKMAKDADSASAYKRVLEARLKASEDDLQLPHIAKGHTSDHIEAASAAADAREKADAEREEREVTPEEEARIEELEREEAARKQAESEAEARERERIEARRKELEEAETQTPTRPQYWIDDFEKWEWLHNHPAARTKEDRAWMQAYEDRLGVTDDVE